MTPTPILWAVAGSPAVPNAEPHEGRCWICASDMARGVRVDRWMGASFTGQNRVRSPTSSHVCEPCVWAMAGKPPHTLRMTSHLWAEGEPYLTPNKGGKPAMRAFLRAPHAGPWFAAIADSGQKHIVPWTPVNPAGTKRGRVAFEDRTVTIGDWAALDATTALLTGGTTKEEILRGDYGQRAWQLCGDALREFEREHGGLRGGWWFELVVFLAQRDEAVVAERMDREKTDRAEKKAVAKAREKAAKPQKASKPRGKVGRKGEGAAEDSHRGDDSGPAGGVPANAGLQRPEALGPDPGPAPGSGKNKREPGGVALDDGAHAATRGTGQLGLWDTEGAGGRGDGARRKGRVARSD